MPKFFNPPGEGVIGRLGTHLLRIHNGDPLCAVTIGWEHPTSGPADYYNVYQKNGTLWSFVGSTSDNEISIDNITADAERGLPVIRSPLENPLISKIIPRSRAEKSYTLGSEEKFNDLDDRPDADLSANPGCSTFYEQRHVFAGANNDPAVPYFSKVAQFADHSISEPRQDDDAIFRELSSGEAEEIRYMAALTDLLVFTSENEYRIRSAGETGLTPSSITSGRQSFYGTSNVQPVFARGKVIMVQKGGKEIRDFLFDFQSDTYAGAELTILAPHLFRNDRVRDMAYRDGDDSFLFVVTQKGRLLVQTKDDALSINGWCEWLTGNNDPVRSVSVLDSGDNTSIVMFVVERTDSEGNKFHTTETIDIEAFRPRDAWTDSGAVSSEFLGTARIVYKKGKLVLENIDVKTEGRRSVQSLSLTGVRESVDIYSTSDPQPLTQPSILNDKVFRVGVINGKDIPIIHVNNEVKLNLEVYPHVVPGNVEVWRPVNAVYGLHHLEDKEVAVGINGKFRRPNRGV